MTNQPLNLSAEDDDELIPQLLRRAQSDGVSARTRVEAWYSILGIVLSERRGTADPQRDA